MVYVALLRGVNVGGKTMVNMLSLKTCFEELGYKNVKTYINSGNVIFETGELDPRKLELAVENAILKKFGHNLKVVVRSVEEMEKLIKTIPKSWLTATDKKCNVIFLRHDIDSPELASKFKLKPDVEELVYHPGTLLWAANLNSLSRSAMVKLSSHGAYKDMTIRNLNTTRKIYDLMATAA